MYVHKTIKILVVEDKAVNSEGIVKEILAAKNPTTPPIIAENKNIVSVFLLHNLLS